MKLEAAVIQGDGVGPEMMEEAVRVLQAVCRRFGHHLKLYPVLACSQAIEAGKEPLPQESLKICTQVPAVLFGNSGLKKYQDWPLDKRPEGALMILRKVLQVSTNIRPVRMYPSLKCFSPLKAERLEQGMDVAFVRDIAGGVFCSAKVQGNGDGGREAYEYEYYNETIVRKTAYTAFKLAKSRKNKVTNLDKSNVLGSSRLWRQTVQQVSEDFPDVELEHLYIDNAAMELIRNPGRFDVFVTSNLFSLIIFSSGHPGIFTISDGFDPKITGPINFIILFIYDEFVLFSQFLFSHLFLQSIFMIIPSVIDSYYHLNLIILIMIIIVN